MLSTSELSFASCRDATVAAQPRRFPSLRLPTAFLSLVWPLKVQLRTRVAPMEYRSHHYHDSSSCVLDFQASRVSYHMQSAPRQLGHAPELPPESQAQLSLQRGISGRRQCSPRAFTFGHPSPSFGAQRPPPHQRELQQRLLGLKGSRWANQTLPSSYPAPFPAPGGQVIRSTSLDGGSGTERDLAQPAASSGFCLSEGYPRSPATCAPAVKKASDFRCRRVPEEVLRLRHPQDAAQDNRVQLSRSGLSLVSVPLLKWQQPAESDCTQTGQGIFGGNRSRGDSGPGVLESAGGTWKSEATTALSEQTN